MFEYIHISPTTYYKIYNNSKHFCIISLIIYKPIIFLLQESFDKYIKEKYNNYKTRKNRIMSSISTSKTYEQFRKKRFLIYIIEYGDEFLYYKKLTRFFFGFFGLSYIGILWATDLNHSPEFKFLCFIGYSTILTVIGGIYLFFNYSKLDILQFKLKLCVLSSSWAFNAFVIWYQYYTLYRIIVLTLAIGGLLVNILLEIDIYYKNRIVNYIYNYLTIAIMHIRHNSNLIPHYNKQFEIQYSHVFSNYKFFNELHNYTFSDQFIIFRGKLQTEGEKPWVYMKKLLSLDNITIQEFIYKHSNLQPRLTSTN